MTTELIATYRNEADGLEALIMDGNDNFNYRAVLRDSDADETIVVMFRHSYFECMNIVKEFLLDDVTLVKNGE